MVRFPLRVSLSVLAAFSTLYCPLSVAASPAPPVLQFNTARAFPEVAGKKTPTAAPGRVVVPPIGTVSAQGYAGEVEPNGTSATATPIVGTNVVIRANVFPNADVDFYSFTAAAGDRVYAAVNTSWNASGSTDSQLRLFQPDGTTLIELDEDDGAAGGAGASGSTIANAPLAVAGTYFLRVNHASATGQLRPYELHFRLQSGAPTPEVEPNDAPATANVLPASGWVRGARNPAAATEQDWFSFTANAGDSIFLSLDADPERDNVQWNGRLGVALFGDAGNQILVVDDVSVGSVANPLSEAIFMTVKAAGTYFAFVDSATAATGGPTATYTLSVSIHPATNEGVNCTTYASTDVPKTIGPGATLVSSTITVPGNPRIADLDVDVVLNHAFMTEVDAHLRSPAGNDNGLFTDIGSSVAPFQTQMDTIFDDEAAAPPLFTALRGVQVKPEVTYRLSWFDGENAGGVWTLDLRDDVANANGGTLTSWSLRICEPPPPSPCAPGFTPTTVFSTDFESGPAGFTHSGTADEWELGLPATLATGTVGGAVTAFNSCNSGVNCWKTDLDNTYDNAPTTTSVTQDLLSPNISLAGLSAPIVVTWAQRHQIENASFDHMFIDYQQAGGATPVRLFEWLDATPSDGIGNPTVNLGMSSGWGVFSRRVDSLAGLNTELRFHVDEDNTVALAGLAIDDVSITACRALSADLSITKTDNVTTATPGTNVTYTITASNAGTDPVNPATVADTFSAAHAGCTWTCVGAGGGSCTAGPVAGNINDTTVNLPVGGSVTYTAICGVTFGATGTLVNTATVSSSTTNPNPANNSATDTDTLTPMADLTITKTDGVTTATPGGSVTYTIVATNTGPSNAVSSTVADTFPASLTCTWTCTGAGGTCTAAGAGNINDSVNLPAGASVTYTAICTVSAAATGTLSNTATVTSATPDPTPGNNSATDTDTLGAQAELSITKTDGVTNATSGGSVTYTIVASNAGPSNAPGSTVADTFPASLTCTWTCAGAGGTCTAAGAGNINDTANLPVGGSVTYTAICTISGAATGTLANTATVTAAAGITDPNPGNNSATDTDTLGSVINLAITKTDGLTNANSGQATTYTIVASNSGPSSAVGASVTDTFPAGFTGATWTCVGAGGGTCTAAGVGNISDTVNLPGGSSVTYTVNGTIGAAFLGTLSNTATVTSGAATASATDTTQVGSSAAVTGIKTASGSFTPGGTVTYVIKLTNSSAAAQLDNPGDELTDALPSQLTLVSATASSGSATTAGNTVHWNGSIPAGGMVTITITATVHDGTAGQVVTNQGIIHYDADGDGTNEATGTTDDPSRPGGADPTQFTVAGVIAIPTLDGLGLAALVLALAALAAGLLRKRRSA